MEDLDNNWILLNKEVVCAADDDDNSPATLGLKNMRGVFIVVGVGILGRDSIDIFVRPESGPEPCPSHVWSFQTCLNLECHSTECGPD